MGFEWESLPGLLLLTTDNRLVEYPESWTVSQEAVEFWLKGLLEGNITDFGEEQDHLMPDVLLKDLMNETLILNSLNFRKMVGQPNTDCIVFLYSSGKLIKS
mmetsp:Transcript_44157/g.42887  ORF Transcript_44157/g.42887 Transcript_44157/m.42887 type:complete len:102 (-) Transcript_44157:395-700(-)